MTFDDKLGMQVALEEAKKGKLRNIGGINTTPKQFHFRLQTEYCY